jgi:hypothetical protein
MRTWNILVLQLMLIGWLLLSIAVIAMSTFAPRP